MRALLTALLLFALAGSAQAAVSVTITPNYAQLVVGKTLQFTAQVSGDANTDVVWQVDNANGGTAATGTVSTSGLFTAPSTLPKPAYATITAVSKADPSVSATATVTLLAKASSGTTYYVASNGSDGNNGSQGAPWATIQHAAKSVRAGDTVLVRGGVYNEHVSFPVSGSAANGFITFASYPGEVATLDGTGLDIPEHQWGLFTVGDAKYLVIEGFEIRNYTTSSTKDVPIGIYVTGASANVQLVNNYVHDITTTAKTTPKQCASDALGIALYGNKAPQSIDAPVISGNEVAHLKTGCSETVTLNGNVENFAVVSNRVHDNNNIGIDAIGFERTAKDPKYDQARNGVIRGNSVYNITSFGNPDYGNQYAADGIYVDGGTNIVIEQNVIHTVDLGIELASEHKGHVTDLITARNNLVYDGYSAGISIGGYGKNRGGTDRCNVVGNTLYANDTKKTGSGEFQIQFNATNNIFEDNIVYAGPQNLFVNDYTDSVAEPAVLDYNLYFSPAGAAKAKFTWQKKSYTGYAKYLQASGMDQHSPAFSDPQFLNAPGNFDIEASSPARNVGIVLGPAINGSVDFAGTARIVGGAINIGAYQQ